MQNYHKYYGVIFVIIIDLCYFHVYNSILGGDPNYGKNDDAGLDKMEGRSG